MCVVGKNVLRKKFDMFVLRVKNGWIEKVEKTGLCHKFGNGRQSPRISTTFDNSLGHTHVIVHNIDTGASSPIRQHPRRLPYHRRH